MNFPSSRLRSLAFAFLSFLPLPLSAQTPTPTPLTVDQTDMDLRVDGHLSNWPVARMIPLLRKDQLTYGKIYWKGADDFSGRVFITYNTEFLYVAAIVTRQGNPVDPPDYQSLWNGDCLELFISTQWKNGGAHRLSKGDYHIGLAPGTGCRSPRMYCFNKDETITGGRINARKSLKGYILEACIPLSFFQGLDLGPGKTAGFDAALDEGGELSGYRIVQLDYGGLQANPDNPSTWSTLQWIGNIEQSFPLEEAEDIYAGLVLDGTKGNVYFGRRTVSGQVLDSAGKPVAGARISTWPKSQEVLSDEDGNFTLTKIKAYDKTVFYARREGYTDSVSTLPSKAKTVTLRLSPLPAAWKESPSTISPFFFGLSIPSESPDHFNELVSKILPAMKALNPTILRLGLGASGLTPEQDRQVLDRFVGLARQAGAEPMISVPLDPSSKDKAAQWVHYCNVEKNYKVRYWTIGDEPDTKGDRSGSQDEKNYNDYNYINDFRTLYNAMKIEDSSILVLGPEVSAKYTEGEEDWISPLVRYDGDIIDGVSIHQFATQDSAPLAPPTLFNDLSGKATLVRTLRDKISQNSDHDIPLAVTGEAAYAGPVVVPSPSPTASPGAVTVKAMNDTASIQFLAALWEAEKKGNFLKEHLAIDLSLYPWEADSAGVSLQPGPVYWALQFWGRMNRGKVINAQIQRREFSVFATQDPQSRDVTLLILNKGDNYWRPKMMLNGSDTELMVDAGLDQRYDFEIPSYSMSLLELKANRSAGKATVYTLKMAKAGNGPQESVIQPW